MYTSKNTLSYQLGRRPGTVLRDMSAVKLPVVVERLKNYRHCHETMAQPETEAIRFYLMNHAVSIVRSRVGTDTDLGEYLWMVSSYQDNLSETAARLFYYLLLICTRESRHAHWSKGSTKHLSSCYGEVSVGFCKAITGTQSLGAVARLEDLPPDTGIGNYVDCLVAIFNETSFSGGYGGPKWGEVTKCLRDFVYGKTTPEIMVDTGWTLCHNNGPIFNKGMLYKTYSGSAIQKILDAQRAGMIPQYVDTYGSTYITPDIKEWHGKAGKLLGKEFYGMVDWTLAAKLGAKMLHDHSKPKPKPKQSVPAGDVLQLTPLLTVKKAALIRSGV